MICRVIYTKPFLRDIDQHTDYLIAKGVSIETVMSWYDRLFAHIDGLYEIPKRLPVDEKMTELTGHITRKMNFGDYLIFYRVLDDRQIVEVLHFQHGARERERYAE